MPLCPCILEPQLQSNLKVTSPIDYFDLGVGVLQGDTLAPCIFVLVIDWIMRNAIPDASLGFCIRERVGTRSRCTAPALYLTDLDFADDIAVLSSTAANMQTMILSVEHWALNKGWTQNQWSQDRIYGIWVLRPSSSPCQFPPILWP